MALLRGAPTDRLKAAYDALTSPRQPSDSAYSTDREDQ